MVKEIIVSNANERERLDRFIATHVLADGSVALSRNAISRAIKKCLVTVNGMCVKSHYRVCVGDRIVVSQEVFRTAKSLVPDKAVVFDTLFVHTSFIVINKPAGLLVHPVHPGDTTQTLVHGLLAHYPEIATVGEDVMRPGIVHRLDRETSGVMVVARTQEAFVCLKRMFQERHIKKTYYAIVYGTLNKQRGTITFPLARSVRGDRWVALRTERDKHKGVIRQALTHYAVLCSNGKMSVVCLQPQTGRTHQIRVHMHAKKCPLVGDTLYKRKDRLLMHKIDRHALHSAQLSFWYGGHLWVFCASIPGDMMVLWKDVCRNTLKESG